MPFIPCYAFSVAIISLLINYFQAIKIYFSSTEIHYENGMVSPLVLPVVGVGILWESLVFFCPMAAILGLQQRLFSKFRITTNGGQHIVVTALLLLKWD
jgi:hypothetical protein